MDGQALTTAGSGNSNGKRRQYWEAVAAAESTENNDNRGSFRLPTSENPRRRDGGCLNEERLCGRAAVVAVRRGGVDDDGGVEWRRDENANKKQGIEEARRQKGEMRRKPLLGKKTVLHRLCGGTDVIHGIPTSS
ncbi:hypothetical protein DEO72_LG8g1897 [Vigna unguiculata]|uniref:Uncharacterized protein n=1 Tax=Vigna unguiculata TaxID=3917 RepID=A0A4D6MS15_VIGUN|nr:hypothetical protein DEO72_LG8g1897 [Vigna unguiculata]